MASKRNLYRPAQIQDNVGEKRLRKTLAQGRLITNGGLLQGSIPVSASQGVRPASSSASVLSQLNQSHVSNASANLSLLHHSSLMQGKLDESLFSPRKLVPHVSETKVPYIGPAVSSLDLSECESSDEQFPDQRSHYQMPDQVLCVDASRQTVNPDVSEVDIRIGVDKYPVKITCHSPSASNMHSSLRLPSIVSGDIKSNIKEAIKDDHIEPYTAVQSIPVTPPPGEHKISQFTQPNFSDSEDLDMVPCNYLEDKLRHLSDTNSLHDDTIAKFKACGSAAKDKQPPRTKTEKSARPESKKKGRVIPSRYMQAASKVKTSLVTKMEKNEQQLNNTKVSKSLETATPAVRKISKKVQSADAKSGTRERPHTPENQSVTSTGGKTSTPTMDGSAFTHEMDTDVSAIHADASILAGDTSRLYNNGRTRSRLNHDVMGHSVLSNVSLCKQSSKPKQKLDMKSMQLKLDLQYMHNLQWAVLDAKARRHFQEQEKLAMAQIYGVYEEVEKLRKLKAEKEQQLARLRHTNITDHLVEVQRQCLGPVVNGLPNLQKQYSALAFALDTTRHQIPTKGIHLPDDEDQFHAQLEAQLLESEHLLGEICAVTRQEVPNITAMGNAMVAMEKSVGSMEGELKRIKELLAATETLTMHECSLRVQDMQLFDNSCPA